MNLETCNEDMREVLAFLIHDYFFAKTIDKVRPGGVIAFITSNGISGGTMDKKDDRARCYIARRCDLLGAVRLPDGAFQANAGTDTSMSMVFLQKREAPLRENDPLPDWVTASVIEQHMYTGKDGEEHPGSRIRVTAMTLPSCGISSCPCCGRIGSWTAPLPVFGGTRMVRKTYSLRLGK